MMTTWKMQKDPSIKELAETEIKEKKKSILLLENELMKLLIPKDENDKKNSILEIRAGTGGDEASLFAALRSSRALTLGEQRKEKINNSAL